MAKQTASQSIPAPVVTPPSEPTARDQAGRFTPAVTTRTPEVVQWGNGGPVDDEPTGHEMANGLEVDTGAPVTETTEETTPAETPDSKANEAKEEPKAEPPKIDAEMRARMMASLEAERSKRSLESAVVTERQAREAAEARLKSITLDDFLGHKGLTKEALLEQLLVGGDIDRPTAQPVTQHAPEVAQLKTELDSVKQQLAQRAQAEQQQMVNQALSNVQASLQSVETVPMVKAMPEGLSRTLDLAYQAWQHNLKESPGTAGNLPDYLPAAAEHAEGELRAKYPSLAAAIPVKSATAPAAAEVAAKVNGVSGIGKRNGARTDPKPPPLPADPYEADRLIKKEMGWD